MYNERQLKIRGNIFKHGYIFIAVYMVVTALISSSDILWFAEIANAMVGLSLSATVCCIEMILRDAYVPEGENKHIIMIVLMGAFFLRIIVHINNVNVLGVVINDKISDDVGYIFIYLSLVLCSIIYLIKYFIDKNGQRYQIIKSNEYKELKTSKS